MKSYRGGRHRYHCATIIVIIIIVVKSRLTNPWLYGLALRMVPSRPRSHMGLLHNVLLCRRGRNHPQSSWFLTTFPAYRPPGFTSALPLNSHLFFHACLCQPLAKPHVLGLGAWLTSPYLWLPGHSPHQDPLPLSSLTPSSLKTLATCTSAPPSLDLIHTQNCLTSEVMSFLVLILDQSS